MKKLTLFVTLVVLSAALFAGCSSSNAAFDSKSHINVVSREDGSGTRGAFIELFGVEEKDADGKKVDKTTQEAMITNNTAVMMTTVAGDKYAIGYISLGSLNDTVKGLNIDGAIASAENIKSGVYKIARPFNIATKEGASQATKDFIGYILSAEGQKIVEDNKYISAGVGGEYTQTVKEGKIVIAGSSSVTPVMEKLKEGYAIVNPAVKVEIQQSDSTTGMTSTIEGICDIGMASRTLKDSETSKGLTPVVIAIDGIAVIVNKENTMTQITSQQVKDIFVGGVEGWDEVIG